MNEQPEAMRLAGLLELAPEDGVEPQAVEDAAAELLRLHAENESLRAERERNLHSIRVCNEIINKKLDENETLRTGYAAARLEIESLQARIKTMTEEQAEAVGADNHSAAAVVLECGNLYAKVKLINEAFGTTKVGDKFYKTQADSVLEDAGGANWQDISTAPKDGTRFVAVGNNYGLYSEGQHTCIAQWFRGCWMDVSEWNETSELKYLTHWMPLLPLPGSAARKQGANHD